jgi:hypothetical protein
MTTRSTLSTKDRVLIGTSAAIAAGCQPCTRILIQVACKAGACERGIRLAIESGILARTLATQAMARWGEAEQGEPPALGAASRSEKTRANARASAGIVDNDTSEVRCCGVSSVS